MSTKTSPKRNGLAIATLLAAIVAAIASIASVIISNVISANSQNDTRRASAYNTFISSANAYEDNLFSSYDTIAKIYSPKQSRLAIASYDSLTNTVKTEFSTSEEQLGLVASPTVVRAASSVAATINKVEIDFVQLLSYPDQQQLTVLAENDGSFDKTMNNFIRSAGGSPPAS